MNLTGQCMRVLECFCEEVREANNVVACFEFFSDTAKRDGWRKEKWKNVGGYGWQDRVRIEQDRLHGGLPVALDQLRELNRQHRDIYFRPGQSESEDSVIAYPYFFMDDVPVMKAMQIGRRYRTLVIRTSEEGGCQLILFTEQSLTRRQRGNVQKIASRMAGGDPGATSGIQPMRLPGTKNWKRGGVFVDVLKTPDKSLPRFDVGRLNVSQEKSVGDLHDQIITSQAKSTRSLGADVLMGLTNELHALIKLELEGTNDRSVADFRAVLSLLRSGVNQDDLIQTLSALSTRKVGHSLDYAARTVAKAQACRTIAHLPAA